MTTTREENMKVLKQQSDASGAKKEKENERRKTETEERAAKN